MALALSRKANRPVKLTMTRDEVFRASGPTSATSIDVRIGAKKDGTIVAADATLRFTNGPYYGMWAELGAMTAFACYDLKNVRTVGYEVFVNRPKTAAYRAPSAPMAAFAVESAIDELAHKIGMNEVDFRIKNAAKQGTRASYGPVYGPIGIGATLEAAKKHPHMKAPLGKNQGRGMACGFWFNFGGQTCTDINIGPDGSVTLTVGTVDVGGSRASLALCVAEELGVPYEQVKCLVADTGTLGHNDMTDGSRGTFSSSMAGIFAARNAITVLRERAAKMWEIPVDDVKWEDGHAKAVGSKYGNLAPLSIKEIAAAAGNTGGPIAGHSEIVADGAGVSFATHIADVEVDPETGRSKIVRYTVIQDAGKAVHPTYVEGQYQGGAAQGIGWALNEEYIYGKDGRLQNPGFLDYRIPVCSDLPMIDTQILEIPNPNHPYGVRGVGETSIVPPLAAIANAMSNAFGVRMTHVPMSPPRVLKALEATQEGLSWPTSTFGGRSVRQRTERPSFQSTPRPSASCSASSRKPTPAWPRTSPAASPSRSTAASTATTGDANCRKERRSICCRGFRAGEAFRTKTRFRRIFPIFHLSRLDRGILFRRRKKGRPGQAGAK